jgi:hypothetical protein
MLLLNGRVRIPAFPTQRFSEYTGQRNINPLLRNFYKQNAYFRGNEYIEKPLLRERNRGRIVEFPQQRDTLLKVDLDSQELVTNSQPVSQLAISIEDR